MQSFTDKKKKGFIDNGKISARKGVGPREGLDAEWRGDTEKATEGLD